MNTKQINEELKKHLKEDEDVMTVQELYADIKMYISALQKGLDLLDAGEYFEESLGYFSTVANDLVYTINKFKGEDE